MAQSLGVPPSDVGNAGQALVGGDTYRGRAERMNHVQMGSSKFEQDYVALTEILD